MADWVEDPDWPEHLAGELRRVLDKVSDGVLRDAVTGAPVDTGHLKNSLRKHLVDSETAHIGTDVEYGLYVEEGHRIAYRGRDGRKHFTGGVVPPAPYLKPALYRAREV